MFAAYIQLFTAIWTIFITAKALYYRNQSEDDEQSLIPRQNIHAMQFKIGRRNKAMQPVDDLGHAQLS